MIPKRKLNEMARFVLRHSGHGSGMSLREIGPAAIKQLQPFINRGWLSTGRHVSTDKKPSIIYANRDKMRHVERYYKLFLWRNKDKN